LTRNWQEADDHCVEQTLSNAPLTQETLGDGMTNSTFEWNQQTWEASVSGQCWWFTPYDAGWDECRKYGADIAADGELRQIIQMEQKASPIPEWAREFVRISVHLPAPCGHYSFPQPCLEAIAAIASGELPKHVHGCYTADSNRKKRMQDYLLCLDAWLKGAGPSDVIPELALNGSDSVDWETLCTSLWQVLGESTQLKRLLVERTCHRYRWWVKTLTWDDDSRNRFEQARYLGDIRGSGDTYGNSEFKDPYFTELESPEAKGIEAGLDDLDPDWKSKFGRLQDTWLCGPKSFRFLERILWAIGNESAVSTDEPVPGFLMCQDTTPNPEQAAAWWREFLAALDAWWQEQPAGGSLAENVNTRLGKSTPLKRWLVRLYAKRLRVIEKTGDIGKLVKAT